MADAVLADVLRQLMFTPEKAGQKFVPFESVDYADLSVQQLGSIYEGLLEHHFVRENGKLVLKTDKARTQSHRHLLHARLRRQIHRRANVTPLLQEIEQREPVKAARAAGKQDNSFANEVLKLNICDPAMGSGHFLVEATTFLADHIVYHPTTKFQAEFVKGESQEEAEIAYWRRRVVETCIYGVDLNPLAVESGQTFPLAHHHFHRPAAQLPRPPPPLRQLAHRRKAGRRWQPAHSRGLLSCSWTLTARPNCFAIMETRVFKIPSQCALPRSQFAAKRISETD